MRYIIKFRYLLLLFVILSLVYLIPRTYALFVSKDDKILTLEAFDIKYENNMTIINTKAKNISDKDINLSFLNIIIYDEDKNEVFNENVYIGSKIRVDEEKPVRIQISKELKNIATTEYKIIR